MKSLARVHKSSFWQSLLRVSSLCIRRLLSGAFIHQECWAMPKCPLPEFQNRIIAWHTEPQTVWKQLWLNVRNDLEDSLCDHFKNRLLKIQAALAYPRAKNIHFCVLFDEYTFLHSICQVYDCSVIWAALSLMIPIKIHIFKKKKKKNAHICIPYSRSKMLIS